MISDILYEIAVSRYIQIFVFKYLFTEGMKKRLMPIMTWAFLISVVINQYINENFTL